MDTTEKVSLLLTTETYTYYDISYLLEINLHKFLLYMDDLVRYTFVLKIKHKEAVEAAMTIIIQNHYKECYTCLN